MTAEQCWKEWADKNTDKDLRYLKAGFIAGFKMGYAVALDEVTDDQD